jgi:hypothetical protein
MHALLRRSMPWPLQHLTRRLATTQVEYRAETSTALSTLVRYGAAYGPLTLSSQ